ncbi:hypothetical protein THAOC_00858, partial [Thalassiosira oceanica]
RFRPRAAPPAAAHRRQATEPERRSAEVPPPHHPVPVPPPTPHQSCQSSRLPLAAPPFALPSRSLPTTFAPQPRRLAPRHRYDIKHRKTVALPTFPTSFRARCQVTSFVSPGRSCDVAVSRSFVPMNAEKIVTLHFSLRSASGGRLNLSAPWPLLLVPGIGADRDRPPAGVGGKRPFHVLRGGPWTAQTDPHEKPTSLAFT